jgi:serine/threonine protein phosphatase 1
MPKRTIAIGDIHGCDKALAAVLRAIEPGPDDTIIPLGDFIDRGPDSRGVIDRLIALGGQCRVIPLLGNHEVMMLQAIDGNDEFWSDCGGRETIDSYGGDLKNVPEQHERFLHRLRLYYENREHIFVHANYDDQLPMERQPTHVALWCHLTEWQPPTHRSGKTVFVGHTPQRDGEVLDLGHLVCLDTFVVGGGYLTAMEVNTRKVWQADREGRVRQRGTLAGESL